MRGSSPGWQGGTGSQAKEGWGQRLPPSVLLADVPVSVDCDRKALGVWTLFPARRDPASCVLLGMALGQNEGDKLEGREAGQRVELGMKRLSQRIVPGPSDGERPRSAQEKQPDAEMSEPLAWLLHPQGA